LESELNDSNYNSSTTATKDTSNKFSSRSAGRWTKEEHQKFVEGLRKYGKNWKEVEAFVGTRNGAQIRSHAQKFFNRLEREYSVKLNNGKPQNAKKKGKESIRKISDSSISTYNSSHENMSDDSKSIDFSKEEMTKIEKVNIITKEPEIIQSIAPVVEKKLNPPMSKYKISSRMCSSSARSEGRPSRWTILHLLHFLLTPFTISSYPRLIKLTQTSTLNFQSFLISLLCHVIKDT